MSALSAAASDEDGDKIKELQWRLNAAQECIRTLHAENEELLEALKTLTAYLGKTATHTSDLEAVWDAEKVIGKATGETK